MRKVKPIEIKYVYVGDKGTKEEKFQAEKAVEDFYFKLFDFAYANLKKKKKLEHTK